MTSADDVAVVFSGDLGNDSIIGSDKADTIFGGAGNDTIKSDTAIDANIDSLIGGDGNDIFYFTGNTGATATTVNTAGVKADVITDFAVASDKINTGTAYAFGGVIATAAGTLTDEVLYAVSGTYTDAVGATAATFTAKAVSAGGFDTLITVGAAGNATVSATQTLVVLKGVLASDITSGTFVV
jgi:Ca2+-binding RTX toxin-like protein